MSRIEVSAYVDLVDHLDKIDTVDLLDELRRRETGRVADLVRDMRKAWVTRDEDGPAVTARDLGLPEAGDLDAWLSCVAHAAVMGFVAGCGFALLLWAVAS